MRDRSTFSFLIPAYFGRVPVKYARRGGKRWNGGLMPAKYRRDYSSQAWLEMSKLDKRAWSPNEGIFRSGSRCRVSGNLFQPCHGRKRRNSQPAAFYESCPALVFKFPAARIPTDNRLRRIDDEWVKSSWVREFLHFSFRLKGI